MSRCPGVQVPGSGFGHGRGGYNWHAWTACLAHPVQQKVKISDKGEKREWNLKGPPRRIKLFSEGGGQNYSNRIFTLHFNFACCIFFPHFVVIARRNGTRPSHPPWCLPLTPAWPWRPSAPTPPASRPPARKVPWLLKKWWNENICLL